MWLPLPHVLNALPVQVDAWYRSGASASAISVIGIAIAAWALGALIVRTTGSVVAATAGAALLLGNPNVLYVQATAMTEPLLFATAFLSVSLTAAWVDRGAGGGAALPGAAMAAACLTRYEAWPISAAVVALAAAVLLRRGAAARVALDRGLRLAAYPAVAIVLFAMNSRWTTGAWMVGTDFFVPENEALANPGLAWAQVRETLYGMTGSAVVWPAYAATVGLLAAFARSRQRASLVLLLALGAAAVLPWYAYLEGHPLRVRYALPLVAACAAVVAGGIALLWRPLRPIAALAIVWGAFAQTPPFLPTAPVILESHRDAKNMEGRRTVTAYLRAHHDGGVIMMSMGSLAHYMHDLSQHGFGIRTFLHEGNGEIWVYAMTGPRRYVRWVAIEERAEGGDAIFRAAQRDADFLKGFDRVAEGGGVALYRRER